MSFRNFTMHFISQTGNADTVRRLYDLCFDSRTPANSESRVFVFRRLLGLRGHGKAMNLKFAFQAWKSQVL